MKKSYRFFALPGLFLLALIAGLNPASAAGSQKIAPVLQPYVDDGTMAGAVVLVASPEKILDVEAVGYMDLAAKKPMCPDSVFWIASQSKPITAAALMILVDEGKVNVDDPVEKYLPEFKGQMVIAEKDGDHMLLKKPRHPILVREVLTHTSGLPFKSNVENPTLDVYPLATRVRSYAMLPLQTEPGAKSSYANSGINTAGRIVEVVSGMPFEKFLDERIFKPLGMKDTTFWPSKAQQERLAKAYRPDPKNNNLLEETPINQLKYPLDDPERQPMPAGGLFSTAQDVCIFYQMLANNGIYNGKRILSEKSVQQMTSDQSGEANSHYGFGIGASENGFSHGGAYGTNSGYDRKRRIINIFLVQQGGWARDGKNILPLFQKTSLELFGAPGGGNGAQQTVGIPGQGTTPLVPTPEPKASPAR